jgi:hypothetical protein
MATTLPPASEKPVDEGTPPESQAPTKPIRARALILALVVSILVTYAVANANASTIFSIMVPPISGILVLIVVNIPLRNFFPKLALSQTDLIAIFAIASVAGAVSGEFAGNDAPFHRYLPQTARTSDTVKNYFIPNVPDSMAIKDLSQVQDIDGGGKDWHYALHKFVTVLWPKVWPWVILLSAAAIAMLCINSLMRGAWCQRERLAFPLIQFPVALCAGGGSGGMWKSRSMWIAFAIMFSIDILNGLNYLYPNLPYIPVKTLFSIDQAFKDPPWSQIGDFRISIFPFMAAIGLFMPNDMLISFVVFFLLRKATHVILAANGISQQTYSGSGIAPGPPYFDEQTWGAVIGLFLGAIWVSKEYLKGVWRDILKFRPSEDQGVPHFLSFLGLLASSGTVVWFGVFMGGFPLDYAVLYIAAYLMFSIVVTRVRAQLGPPTHEFAYFGVNSLLGRFFGNRWLTDKQATWATSGFMFMNRIYRNHPMPSELESMKMGELERIRQRQLFGALIVAIVIGVIGCFYFQDVLTYRTGGAGYSDGPSFLEKIVGDRHGPDVIGIIMTLFGFVMVMLLDAIRFRFPGFPLHPAGYFLSMNFGIDYYWFGLLLALLVKSFVQRYYGLNGYEKLRAVAMGILLGEYAAETIWMAMALITKQSTYTISFNDRSLGMQ